MACTVLGHDARGFPGTSMGGRSMHLTLGKALLLAALALAAVATAFDCRRGLVPNWLTLSLLPLAPLLHAYGTRGTHGPFGLPGPVFGALASLAGAFLCALVPYVMFRASWMGGADVKLLATIGALLTPHYGLEAELFALVLAAVFVPARLAFDGRLLRAAWSAAKVAVRAPIDAARERRLPQLPDEAFDTLRFSPFVLAGTAAAVLLSPLGPRIAP
jgi:Flp pilus assembly protein protease CpaA